MIESTTSRAVTAAETAALWDRLRHVSWGSIFLGLAIAIAVQILLGLLGIGLGFSIIDPADPMGGIGAWSIATSIYMVVTQIISLFIGGYVASHLAPSLTDRTAIFHGLSIWALSTIVMVWLGTSAVGSAISGATGAVSSIASATGQAITAAVPENISLPDINFQDLPEPVQRTLRENGITPANIRDEVRNSYRDVVSPQEERRLLQELQQAVQSTLRNPTSAGEEISKALDNMFGEGGILNQQDLNQMQNSLQQSLNLSDQEAQEITNQLQQGVTNARETLQTTVEDAQKAALNAADTVTDRIGSIALWLFVASVLGLIAAVIGGRLGEAKAGSLNAR